MNGRNQYNNNLAQHSYSRPSTPAPAKSRHTHLNTNNMARSLNTNNMARSKNLLFLAAFVVFMEFRRSMFVSLSQSSTPSPVPVATATKNKTIQCDERGLDILDKQFDQQRAARQIAMNTSLGREHSFDIYEPEASCFSKERFGSRANDTRYNAFGDGPKFICGVDFIARQTANDGKKCLVYSVGSSNQIEFEKSVHTYMKGCEIHTFDPTLKDDKFIGDEYATFHPWGLGLDGKSKTLRGKAWTSKSFATIIKELGHENRTIDVLKIDCEGCEYKTMPPLFDLISSGRIKVNQVLIELHLRERPSQLKDFFWGADRANMRVFSKERNGWGCFGKSCVEYSLASETFLREANKDTICPSHGRNSKH